LFYTALSDKFANLSQPYRKELDMATKKKKKK
jgi:hypothetical protein